MTHASTITRRLAAVAFADVAGWSALVEKDDVGTLRAWKTLRRDVIEPKIGEHGGRLLEVQGDAVVIEFQSAVSAVRWAIETQQSTAAADDVGFALALRVRIGINVEDVIVDEDKLLGSGVNIASRIHQLASPGEIIVTAAVRDYVWNKLEVSFSDLGQKHLKNISQPIRCFRVDVARLASGADFSQPALAWTRRPSIAVMPFRNRGGDSTDTYFGDGITEDIIGALSRSHALYVIARNSTLRYRDSPLGAREIGAELGVRYILAGSVGRQGSRLRITAELIDADNNLAIWGEKFDGTIEDLFDFQDRIAARIVAAIEPRLFEVEAAMARTKPTDSLDAYDCLLRGLSTLYRFHDDGFEQAGRFFERAIQIDAHYAQAHAYLAWWYNLGIGEARAAMDEKTRRAATLAWTRAMELDVSDAFVLAVAAHAQAFLNKDLDAAAELFDRALSVNENSAFAWGMSAAAYSYLGRPEEALERLRNAFRLSPFEPINFIFWTIAGIAEFIAGRYDNAVAWLRKAQRANPRFLASHRFLTASLGMSGDLDGAKQAGVELLIVEPSITVRGFTSWYPLRRREDLERVAEGFRRGGIPE